MRIESFGDKQLTRDLLRISGNARDMTPAYDDAHKYLLQIESLQFATQGQFSGGWQPLAASTSKAKAAAGLDPRILHATLRLRNSLTRANHPDHVYETRPDGFVFSTRVPYGVYHQKGQGVPMRRPIQFSENVKQRVMKILQQHVMAR